MGLSKIVGDRSVEEVRKEPCSCIGGTEHSCRTPLVLLAFLTEVNRLPGLVSSRRFTEAPPKN